MGKQEKIENVGEGMEAVVGHVYSFECSSLYGAVRSTKGRRFCSSSQTPAELDAPL